MLLERTTVAINLLVNDCLVNPGRIANAVGEGVLVGIFAVVDVSSVVVNSKLEVGAGWVEIALVSANVNADDFRLSM